MPLAGLNHRRLDPNNFERQGIQFLPVNLKMDADTHLLLNIALDGVSRMMAGIAGTSGGSWPARLSQYSVKREVALEQLRGLYQALERRRVAPFEMAITVL